MSKKALCCCFCLILAFFSSKLFAKESTNPGYLADYAVNWSEARQNYANCNTNSVNPQSHFLLGECPSANAIHLYYVTSALVHFTAASLLPERYAKALKNSDVHFNLSMYKDRSQLAVKWNF